MKIQTLIVADTSGIDALDGTCYVENLTVRNPTKSISYAAKTDSGGISGNTREESGEAFIQINYANIILETGRATGTSRSDQTRDVFQVYGGQYLRGIKSGIQVNSLYAELYGNEPMFLSVCFDWISLSGKVYYDKFPVDPANYNFGNDDGLFNSWAALFPSIQQVNSKTLSTYNLIFVGFRFAIAGLFLSMRANFSCVAKGFFEGETVSIGDIREYTGGNWVAESAGTTGGENPEFDPDVTWAEYNFSYTHKNAYRAGFRNREVLPRLAVVAELPIEP